MIYSLAHLLLNLYKQYFQVCWNCIPLEYNLIESKTRSILLLMLILIIGELKVVNPELLSMLSKPVFFWRKSLS